MRKRALAYHPSAVIDRGRAKPAQTSTRPRKGCTYHEHGAFCAQGCSSCEARLITRARQARLAGEARQRTTTDRLMRQARS